MSAHPYAGLPDERFWARAVTTGGMHELDPAGDPSWMISDDDRVMTLGSCFAQHIAAHLRRTGASYLVTEQGPPSLGDHERVRRQFGTFTARYGNVYTVRQALQLLERSLGERRSADDVWSFGDRVVDPHRPTIEPDGFASIEEMEADREVHLNATRQAFIEADVIVFTLGLTEGWLETSSGSMLPLAPGVHGGTFPSNRYAFHNAGFDGCRRDMDRWIERVRAINATCRILLTVSPVPLAATYEQRHVLVSTGASKAVLRVVADEACKRHANVEYFPSFELITAPGYGHRFFEDDLRSVTPVGVGHVMRVFDRAFRGRVPIEVSSVARRLPEAELRRTQEIICDEERLAEH